MAASWQTGKRIDPDATALFLDFDGTLVEIAAAPHLVVVPAGLPGMLDRLTQVFGGAVALVSGRPLDALDTMLAPARFAAAAEHGAVLREVPGAEVREVDLPALPDAWRGAAQDIAAAFTGALVEQKRAGFTIHVRACPDASIPVRAALRTLIASDDHFLLMQAHMAWEVKPRAASKGTAIATLMQAPPFAGRLPIMIGDDVTDEDGFAEARRLGGQGLRVQEVFTDPAGVRAWLSRLVGQAACPAS